MIFGIGIGFRPAGGVWGGMRGGFFSDFWRAGIKTENT